MKYTKTEDASLVGKAEKISDMLSDHYIPERCPNCRGIGYSVFIGTDLISGRAQWDDKVDRWRVGGVSLGNLKLETVQCSSCGWRADLRQGDAKAAPKVEIERRSGG